MLGLGFLHFGLANSMSDVLAQVLSHTAQWSWNSKAHSKFAFELIGGKCFLKNSENILRALQHEMILELMSIHQLSILTVDELKSILKIICPLLPNQTIETIENEVNSTTMRSFMFWLTLNNCLHQIIIKGATDSTIEFMEMNKKLNLSDADFALISVVAEKISVVLDPIFSNMPTVAELKDRWCKDFAKNKQNNIDVLCGTSLICFLLYSFSVGFQYHSHPFTSALFCVGLLFSITCLIRFCLRIRDFSFNEIYCKIFIKNFSKKVRSNNLYSNF